jgi:hypothetical protein
MSITYIIGIFAAFIVILFAFFLRIKKSGSTSDTAIEINGSEGPKIEILEIQISKTEDTTLNPQSSSLSAENMFSNLHGLLTEDSSMQERISFEIVSSGEKGIRFYVFCPSTIVKFVESQIYAQYPTCHIHVVPDYTSSVDRQNKKYGVATISLTRPKFFPIKCFADFEIDPISSITSAMATIGVGEEVWLQVVFKPIADVWQKEGLNYVKAVREGKPTDNPSFLSTLAGAARDETWGLIKGTATGAFTTPLSAEDAKRAARDNSKVLTPRLSANQELEVRAIENKLSRMGYMAQIRIVSVADEESKVENNLRSIFASFKQFSTTNLNSFSYKIENGLSAQFDKFIERRFSKDESVILTTEEMATFYHFPLSNIDTPNISWVYSRKSEPPANLATEDCNYIGETVYRNKKIKFGLKNNDDRLRHLYVIGKSGTGKSTLFESMISQDIANGFGVAVLDPHGETIERVLERIPDNRVEDVIYFDPSDTERPIGLNLLQLDDPSQKNLMASGLVAAIKQHFDFSWGPRLEYLLNYCILTLLEVPGTTLLGVTRLLEDQNYQKYILHQVKDPVVVKFWEQEFKEMRGNQKLVTEAIAPIQNKVNRFLASTTIRNILGQKESTLDIWDAMNNSKILLMNLSKGKIGSDNANLLGALLVSRLQFYALQRARIPYNDRKPFYLYVDEFQNFATGSFEEILSESRKYKLGLYLTHQFTAQLPEDILKAVFGNVGTIISFSLGAPDAKELGREFAPYFAEEDIISLERFQIYMKLMVDGMTSHPFSARILIPWEDGFIVPKTGNKDKVMQLSREKFGIPREFVENKIYKWVDTKFDKGMAIAQEYKQVDNVTTNSSSSS